MTKSEKFELDAKQAIQELGKLASKFETLNDRVKIVNSTFKALEKARDVQVGKLKEWVAKLKDTERGLYQFTVKLGRLTSALDSTIAHIKSLRNNTQQNNSVLKNATIAQEVITAAITKNWHALSAEAQAWVEKTEEGKRFAEAAKHINDSLTDQARVMRESEAATKKETQAQRILEAVIKQTAVGLNAEEQTILQNMLATIQLAEAKSLLSRQVNKTRRDQEKADRERDAALKKQQAETERQRIIQEIYNRVINNTTAALSAEAQAMMASITATQQLARAKAQLNKQQFGAIDAAEKAAEQQRKNRIAGELFAYAQSGGTTTLSAEADQVRQNIEASKQLAAATKVIEQRMYGKNVALDKQGKLWKQDTLAMLQNSHQLEWVSRRMARFGQILQNIVGYGGFFLLFNKLRDSVKDAEAWAEKVSEIRTISDRAAVSSAEWTKQLEAISSAYGIEFTVAAEAAYAALSDQVTEAGDTFGYLRKQIQLAYTAVGSLDSAVQATNSYLTSFGKSTEYASYANAILFKTVDLGRVRLEEMGTTLGRVNILSDQLGISFMEQQASLTVLSRKGIPFSEAMTLMRNVMQKLIKPTEYTENLLRSWGFTSGEAAVRSLGLIGVIQRFAQQALASGDAAAEFGEIMGRMRAIVGLAGTSQADLNAEMAEFQKSFDSNFDAYEERLKSVDITLKVARESFNNFFVTAFGDPAIRKIADMIQKTDGIKQALQEMKETVRFLIIEAGSLWAALRLVNGGIALYTTYTTAATTATVAQTAATGQARRALMLMSAARGAATLGLSIFVTVLITKFFEAGDAVSRFNAILDDTKTKLLKLQELNLARWQKEVDKNTAAVELRFKSLAETISRVSANLQIKVDNVTKSIKKAWEEVGVTFKFVSRNIGKEIGAALAQADSKIEELSQLIERVQNGMTRDEAKVDGQQGILDIEGDESLSQQDKVDKLKALIKTMEAEADKALAAGDMTYFNAMNEQITAATTAMKDQLKKMLADANIIQQEFVRDAWGNIKFDRAGRPRVKQTKVKDPQLVQDLEAQINQAEKDRVAILERQIKLKDDYLARLKTEKEELEKQRQVQQDNLERYQALIEELGTVDLGGDLEEFKKKFQELRGLGGAIGLDPSEQIKVFRELNAKQQLMQQQQAQEAEQQRINQYNAIQQELQNRMTAAQDALQTNSTQALDKQNESATELGTNIKGLAAFLQKVRGDLWAQGVQLPENQTKEGRDRLMKQSADLSEANAALNFISRRLEVAMQSGSQEELARAMQFATSTLKGFDPIIKSLYNVDQKAFAPSGLLTGQNARKIVDPMSGLVDIEYAGQSLKGLTRNIETALALNAESIALQGKAAQAASDVKTLSETLTNAIKNLPTDLQKLIDINNPVASPAGYQTSQLTQTLEDLSMSIKGQAVEVSIGDIYIQTQGTTQQQANEIIQVIQRNIRNGALNVQNGNVRRP